ncbi:MAG: hypothetical protein M3N21_08840 [Actinomycetota bacterium]|nr:hypothetical protein [Actinomycetota bacterium]
MTTTALAPDRVRRNALQILREGRLRMVTVRCEPGTTVPTVVVAQVKGHHGTYAVDRTPGGVWSCTCIAREGCAHIAAARQVTGVDV